MSLADDHPMARPGNVTYDHQLFGCTYKLPTFTNNILKQYDVILDGRYPDLWNHLDVVWTEDFGMEVIAATEQVRKGMGFIYLAYITK